MSPADQADRLPSADVSPTTAVIALPLTEDDVDPDLAKSFGIHHLHLHNTNTNQPPSADAELTVLRPAFWRRKSEEEFLKATVVCVSKGNTSLRSRDGSFSGAEGSLGSPKPSCLKRSPSAPHRPPHSLGLTALRSKSVTSSTCDGRRAVRFDSKPPAAAFTHSGKDYDRTPIESTQGKGGDLDVSLPPRGGSLSPDLDDGDGDGDGDGEDGADVEEGTALPAPTSTSANVGRLFPATLSPEPEHASPSFASYSEATSTSSASSVFYDSDSSATSTNNSGANELSSYKSADGGDCFTSLIGGINNEKGEMDLASTTTTTLGPSKWAASVPCSTEVERAMLRRKLEFGGRWMKNFALSFDEDVTPTTTTTSLAAVTTVVTAAEMEPSSYSIVTVGMGVGVGLDPFEHETPNSSDLSVLSSTLCGSSVEGGSTLAEDSSSGTSGRCAFSKVLSKTFLPMSSACRRFDDRDEESTPDTTPTEIPSTGFPMWTGESTMSMPTTSPGSSPEKDSKSLCRTTSASTTTKKKKKTRCLNASGGSEGNAAGEKASAFACRRDFLLENVMGGGALDGF
ncbi:hypothetical protein CF319_g1683 [Tilletia indica]|nr:hypothetical protein CF319_g1683 [Tilletia indica]